MDVLVTGGCGFIGRWVVKRFLEDDACVHVLDDLSNGRSENLDEFRDNRNLQLTIGDINDTALLLKLYKNKFDICLHLAASIVVQDSIDNPKQTFKNDVIGTFNMLEESRKSDTKFVFMSTCMVYDTAAAGGAISETHPTKPASPYAGAKIAGENMVQSYYYAYGLPTVILRPFNTYGPFQKSTGEGGVVSVFIQRELNKQVLNIFGDGKQTRDLMYAEDCAEFVVKAAYSDDVNGEILNAGSGEDITINSLAAMICKDPVRIKHVKHIHPQSEIPKLVCDYSKAKDKLGWVPKTKLQKGIESVKKWMKNQ
ncbi:MAG TPA: GDP-mannose 4,6-dehydratase [Candidatus Methanoperedens sp.]